MPGLTTLDWAVVLAAIGGIALVNWYFLFSKNTGRAGVSTSGAQEVTVRVEGGYDPAVIELEAGRLVRLIFDRREDNPCSEAVVLPAFGIHRDLPAFAQTSVEFTPPTPGRYEFTCGMGMLHGALVIRNPAPRV
ncbi:MAG: cupredoxin domain-containing protein [Acidobacteriota bacterium]